LNSSLLKGAVLFNFLDAEQLRIVLFFRPGDKILSNFQQRWKTMAFDKCIMKRSKYG
jgi:hypothetical protein